MSQMPQPTHTPWIDRFNTPSIDTLLEQYESHALTLAQNALKGLTEIVETEPAIEWKGLPWRWTCVYRAEGEPEPCVYLIPTPDWPSIAMPVPASVVEELLAKRSSSRYIKETLLHACQVGHIRWAEWSIQGRAQLSDVLGLAQGIINGQPV
ncbi:MAG: hypothetical protein ED559_05010 [Phycisphaera sp.]|nr:MAG: hypothetical protein ED559_05010 [Phycisphaera sp.]